MYIYIYLHMYTFVHIYIYAYILVCCLLSVAYSNHVFCLARFFLGDLGFRKGREGYNNSFDGKRPGMQPVPAPLEVNLGIGSKNYSKGE